MAHVGCESWGAGETEGGGDESVRGVFRNAGGGGEEDGRGEACVGSDKVWNELQHDRG